jgi:transcriptional regulator with XRE-family HTH domain
VPRDLPEDDDYDDLIRAHQQAFGSRVQAERYRQNLTQEDVFLAARIDRRTLQAIEAGTGNPTFTTLLRLAHVRGVPPGELVG